ncbi:HNH endonuclease [Paenibacillus sp. 2TAF8]
MSGGKRPQGKTWNYFKIEVRMGLVPICIHNSINHQGGRAPGGLGAC